MPIVPGDVAPRFTLPTDAGSTFALADIDQSVLLWWYPKASTPTCTKEGCSLRDARHAFDDADCLVVGISYDSVEDNRQFAEEHQVGFQLLSDPDRAVSQAYGVVRRTGEPYDDMPLRVSFLIDPSGTIVNVYEVTDVATHVADVLADMRAARAAPDTRS